MRQLLRNNALFIGLSLLLLAVLGLALLYIPKGDLHLLLCDRHAHARDIFYRYYTHVAEWFPYVVCVGLLLFGRVGNGLLASSCMVFSALTTQLFKHIINAPRPITWFAANMPDIQLPLVEGVRMNEWYSFPSSPCPVASARIAAAQSARPKSCVRDTDSRVRSHETYPRSM